MEPSKTEPTTLHVFECKIGHRIARRDDRNASGCSRCGGAPLYKIGAINRNEGEEPIQHQIRALAMRKVKIH